MSFLFNLFRSNRSKKWREDGIDKWDRTTMEGLFKDVGNLNSDLKEARGHGESSHLKVQLIGSAASGKSALINTIHSALLGDVSSLANAGGSGIEHVTTRYREFLCGHGGRANDLQIKFADIRGIGEKGCGISTADLKRAVTGQLHNDTRVQPDSADAPVFIEDKYAQNDVAMVFFVFDIIDVQHFFKEDYATIREAYVEMRSFCDEKNIPFGIFLTKSDLLSKSVKRDLSNLHKSSTIGKEVKTASAAFSVDEANIFPVVNYTTEQTFSPEKAIQILYALRYLFKVIAGRQKQRQLSMRTQPNADNLAHGSAQRRGASVPPYQRE